MKQFLGLHHVSAITDNAERNYKFFTEVLGMRLVKKTVNQDDIQTYHTFYADDIASPGTEMTFFEFRDAARSIHGTNSISRASFRVPSDKAIEYYKKRFEEFGVLHGDIEELFGKKILKFEESDGQKYQLISDENNSGVAAGVAWKNGPVPEEFAINGLGPIEITVSYFERFKEILEQVYLMREVIKEEGVSVYEMGEGGNGAQIILREDTSSRVSTKGHGEIHHVALRVENQEDLLAWKERYKEFGIGNSGYVDRFYFGALYARIGHILFEISTDGPGFMQDEPYESLGESLSLPPFLEHQREKIESLVRPFNTKRE